MKTPLDKYMNSIKKVKGDFAEFGVYRGVSFEIWIPYAKAQKKILYGVDSFCGMPEPTLSDYNKSGTTRYIKGVFNTKGSKDIVKRLNKTGFIKNKDYILFEGFVPEILKKFKKDIIFSFAYIDFDQYQSTVDAINFVWPRLSVNGLILFDDYISSLDRLASKAIKEFLKKKSNYVIERQGKKLVMGGCKTQLLIRKTKNEYQKER